MLKKFFYFVFSIVTALLPSLSEAKCYTDTMLMTKLHDIVFVVYCEDRTDETAMKLVMSTIYNRAQSHDVNLLHNEVSKKNQYYCFNMKAKTKKINQAEYEKVEAVVCDFITNERSPISRAKYFYNHKLVNPSFIKTLTVVRVYGSHTYLM